MTSSLPFDVPDRFSLGDDGVFYEAVQHTLNARLLLSPTHTGKTPIIRSSQRWQHGKLQGQVTNNLLKFHAYAKFQHQHAAKCKNPLPHYAFENKQGPGYSHPSAEFYWLVTRFLPNTQLVQTTSDSPLRVCQRHLVVATLASKEPYACVTSACMWQPFGSKIYTKTM